MKSLVLFQLLRIGALEAQAVSLSPVYRFEEAVIKPSKPGSIDVWMIPESYGGYRAQNVTVWRLITGAYYIRDQQLAGGPAWIRNDRYDIIAKPEKIEFDAVGLTSSASDFADFMSRNRERMQALLRERFGLVLRTETKVMPCYSLKLSPTGSKMQVAGDHDGSPIARIGHGHLAMTTDLKGIAAMLTDAVGRPVIDETGLFGYYTVKLEWTPDNVDPSIEGGGSIFTAIKEQLGLQLKAGRSPVPVFVIDKIERPSDN
jgi:uncharacterized protein (TIGR03435 family)